MAKLDNLKIYKTADKYQQQGIKTFVVGCRRIDLQAVRTGLTRRGWQVRIRKGDRKNAFVALHVSQQ